jgi:transposase
MTKVVYVGLDVHAETIAVATADEGRNGEVRFHGVIANTVEALKALSARLSRNGTQPDFAMKLGLAATACIAA